MTQHTMTFFWVLAALAYMAVLFLLAQRGDKPNTSAYRWARHPAIYGLGLGIYCTSWTYYGAVGSAAKDQWQFLPILLGPILLFLFGQRLLRKMVDVSKRHNITSIADFISSRYGKRRDIAVMVTLLMTVAILPYIALQLKAVDASFTVLAGLEGNDQGSYKAFITAIIMALFAIIFGTRHTELTQYRSGLMLAIGVESLVKLLGLCVAAVFAVYVIHQSPLPEGDANAVFEPWFHWSGSWLDFSLQTLMAAAVILCLPRQFQVMVVDNHDPKHLKTSRWLFPLYLTVMALAIAPIAMAGQLQFGATVDSDSYLMALAGSQGAAFLSLMVFIGGISAASAMIIVSSLALSTMLTNDVLIPLLMRNNPKRWLQQQQGYQRSWMMLRRWVILLILLLSYLYYSGWGSDSALANMGLLAFSLVVQLTPFIIGGLYWKRGHASGVIAGLTAGLITWTLVVAFPLMEHPLLEANSIFARGTIMSLCANTLTYVLFSMIAGPRLVDRVQASAFVQPSQTDAMPQRVPIHSQVKNADLIELVTTFAGNSRTQHLLSRFEEKHGNRIDPTATPSDEFIQFCERTLASILGSSSAGNLISVLLSGQQLNVEDVFSFFEDTTEALKTNQAILFSSLENLSQGISVVDKDLRLVAWNKSYLDLFHYPQGLVEVGQPIETLIRFNTERGECGPGDIDELVEKRLSHLRNGSAHRFIRRRSDGRVIEMIGNPLPNGGFVTSFTDITEHVEIQKALKEANINLEKRVEDRTEEIRTINAELNRARDEAEDANQSKTRFLALASHDILQPLNAAKLYLSSMDLNDMGAHNQSLLHKLDDSLQTSEQLISTLLEIAKLEQGALQPTFTTLDLNELLTKLNTAYQPMALQNGVALKFRSCQAVTRSDETFLRRILQNLISNAIKYSPQGRVLVGVRPRGEDWLIQVWDTGLGISEAEHSEVFSDFYRAHRGDIKGVGLGLSVVKKMSEQLGHPVALTSQLGRGSCFSVRVPRLSASVYSAPISPSVQQTDGMNLRVLCVDDNRTNLDALENLLYKWQCQCDSMNQSGDAIDYAHQHAPPDAVIMDYQLNEPHVDGLQLIAQLREVWQQPVPALLVTAAKEESTRQQAKDASVGFLNKPIKAGALRAWLAHQQRY